MAESVVDALRTSDVALERLGVLTGAAFSRRDRNRGFFAMRLARAGIPVFPLVANGKRPATEHGFLDASTDMERVTGWWRKTPAANVGIPTGAVSGIDVVDVDTRPEGDGFDAWAAVQREGIGLGWGMQVRSPSGGLHFYYPARMDTPNRSWSSDGHVDFRGDGGYIVAPGSQVLLGDGHIRRYEAVDYHIHGREPVDGPRIRGLVDPGWLERQNRPRPVNPMPQRVDGLGERMASFVATLQAGSRNAGLFWAASQMASAGVSLDETEQALRDVALNVGLDPREIAATLRSAYRNPAPPRTDFRSSWTGVRSAPQTSAASVVENAHPATDPRGVTYGGHMSISTSMSMTGFIVSEPQISVMPNGDTRAYVRVGQDHAQKMDDGTYQRLEPSFHDMVVWRKAGETLVDRFEKGDRFIAEGYVHTYQGADRDGVVVDKEEFVARKIGHDAAQTPYTVDRSARQYQERKPAQTHTRTQGPAAQVSPVVSVVSQPVTAAPSQASGRQPEQPARTVTAARHASMVRGH